jgi:hypothetical protein
MHAAPPVSYPSGRSRHAGAVSAAVWLAGVAAMAAWTAQASDVGWRHGIGFAALAACGLAALAGWRSAGSGTLSWDGAGWQWHAAGGDAEAGIPDAVLDLQSWMLVRWRPVPTQALRAGARWFWLERESAPSHWAAMRRAVYSRARIEAPDGARDASQAQR